MIDEDDDDTSDHIGMTEEEIAALPLDPAEIFDPAGLVSDDGVHGDALLARPAAEKK